MSVGWFSFILSFSFSLFPFTLLFLSPFPLLLLIFVPSFFAFFLFYPFSVFFSLQSSVLIFTIPVFICPCFHPFAFSFHLILLFLFRLPFSPFFFFPLTILSISFILPVSFFRHFWLTVMFTPIQKLSAISGVSEQGHIIMTYEPDLASQYREQPGAKYLGWGHTAKTAVDTFKIMGHPNCWIWTNSVYISSPDFQKPNVNKSKSTLRKLQKHTFFKRRSWRNTHAHTSLQHLSCIFIY